MKSVFNNSAELEAKVKTEFDVPQFVMMENAAIGMKNLIVENFSNTDKASSLPVIIVCGKGNNGADGYALARHLQPFFQVSLVAFEEPKSQEAKIWHSTCQKLAIPFLAVSDFYNLSSSKKNKAIIVDCIYGTGFHGELSSNAASLIAAMNDFNGPKIACDIPSAFEFCADYTITMGTLKLQLFSDKAKQACGNIIVADLGFSPEVFESQGQATAYFIEQDDLKLPFRKKRNAHKGTYGHAVIFAGDKAGAGILAASAAMNFGAGLTSILKTHQSNLEQFKIDSQLMIADSIPKKATAILIGPGVTQHPQTDNQMIMDWFQKTKNPALVLDAGMFDFEQIASFLKELNNVENSRIILTPHLLELSRLLKKVASQFPETGITQEDCNVKNLADNPETKIKVGKILNQLYPNTAVIMKSANTFIAYGKECYIVTQGCQNLAKGGSGDVLAGLCVSLLAQGYTAKDAAISSSLAHALASQKLGAESFNVTSEVLINTIWNLIKSLFHQSKK